MHSMYLPMRYRMHTLLFEEYSSLKEFEAPMLELIHALEELDLLALQLAEEHVSEA